MVIVFWELIWLAHERKTIQSLGSNMTEGGDVRGGRSSAEMASDSASLSQFPANRAYLVVPS